MLFDNGHRDAYIGLGLVYLMCWAIAIVFDNDSEGYIGLVYLNGWA